MRKGGGDRQIGGKDVYGETTSEIRDALFSNFSQVDLVLFVKYCSLIETGREKSA